MPLWDWKEEMYGLQQEFTIWRRNKTAVFDLTGYTVTIYVFKAGVLLFSLVGIVDAVPTTGKCYFTPTIADFVSGSAETYRFEVEMTKVGAVVKTLDELVEVTSTRP